MCEIFCTRKIRRYLEVMRFIANVCAGEELILQIEF